MRSKVLKSVSLRASAKERRQFVFLKLGDSLRHNSNSRLPGWKTRVAGCTVHIHLQSKVAFLRHTNSKQTQTSISKLNYVFFIDLQSNVLAGSRQDVPSDSVALIKNKVQLVHSSFFKGAGYLLRSLLAADFFVVAKRNVKCPLWLLTLLD